MYVYIYIYIYIISYQLKLIKMRAELANLNYCTEPFLRRAAVNFCWYYYIYIYKFTRHVSTSDFPTPEAGDIYIYIHIDIYA